MFAFIAFTGSTLADGQITSRRYIDHFLLAECCAKFRRLWTYDVTGSIPEDFNARTSGEASVAIVFAIDTAYGIKYSRADAFHGLVSTTPASTSFLEEIPETVLTHETCILAIDAIHAMVNHIIGGGVTAFRGSGTFADVTAIDILL